jgi:hypothetical protein
LSLAAGGHYETELPAPKMVVALPAGIASFKQSELLLAWW